MGFRDLRRELLFFELIDRGETTAQAAMNVGWRLRDVWAKRQESEKFEAAYQEALEIRRQMLTRDH